MRRLLAALAVSVLLCAPAMGATMSADVIKGTNSQTQLFVNETIPTSSYIEKTFYNVGGYNSIIFTVNAVSAGTLVTANVDWFVQSGGGLVTINSTVEYENTPITDFRSDIVRIRLPSNQSAPVTATGSILFTYNGLKLIKSIKGNLSHDIPASSTTVTVTEATQGYWYFRTDAKIYIDWAGGTATSDDSVFNALDALDTYPVYLRSGDVIKILSDSGTAHIRGFVYE